MKIDNGVWFFLIFGNLENNLMKLYLVPDSIVNYIKFVFPKLLIYFVITNGKGCKPAQARVLWVAWRVSLKTLREVLIDMFLSWAVLFDIFLCSHFLMVNFSITSTYLVFVCVSCHFLYPGIGASLLLRRKKKLFFLKKMLWWYFTL